MNKFSITSDEIITFWLNLFSAMSMSSELFGSFLDGLQFPVDLTDEVISNAKDCAINLLNTMSFNTPERPSNDLLTASNDKEDTLIQICEVTFYKLETIDYALPIYEWGKKQINRNHKYHIKYEIWDLLLLSWADNPPNTHLILTNLKLPEHIIQKLKIITLKYFIRYQKVHINSYRIKDNITSLGIYKPWDAYLFINQKIGTWVVNQTSVNMHILKWQEIFNLLSKDEIETLEKWGYENIESNNIESPNFSLSNLVKDIV